MSKKLLSSLLGVSLAASLAAVIVPQASANQALDENDISTNDYLNKRAVEVGEGNGEIDLSTLPENGAPTKLELHLHNSAAEAVNVRIPDLGLSFLVPANSDRTHTLSLSAVGKPGVVDFTTEKLGADAMTSTTTTSTTTYSSTPSTTTGSGGSTPATSVPSLNPPNVSE
ncbi:MAG: hypothetical protein VKJ04_07185 [Vampirovibrionales bacterium]|nr:hypothetical protein [Vampirovibrionales bacterium]